MGKRGLEKIHEEALESLLVVGFVDRDGQMVIKIDRTNPLLGFLDGRHHVYVSEDNVEGGDRVVQTIYGVFDQVVFPRAFTDEVLPARLQIFLSLTSIGTQNAALNLSRSREHLMTFPIGAA
jgi:hypothetical protein